MARVKGAAPPDAAGRRDHADAAAVVGLPALIVFLRSDDVLAGILAPVGIGLATAWLTWAAYASGASRPPAGLVEVADWLAQEVSNQLQDHPAVSRGNNPWPLPVARAPADWPASSITPGRQPVIC